jgi:hypothetical protein
MKSRDVYVLLCEQQLAICLAASLQEFLPALRFPAMASSLMVRVERDKPLKSPATGDARPYGTAGFLPFALILSPVATANLTLRSGE